MGEYMEVAEFGSDFTEWLQIVKHEIEEANSRSVVIVCASILDTQLEKLLKKMFCQDKNLDEKLFLGANAILASFGSKITMAYYLKIISEEEMKLLNAVRKIRNKFAHEIDISKDRISDSISDMCLNLNIPQGMYVSIEAFIGNISTIDTRYDPNTEKDPIKRFINTFFFLSQYLFLHNLEYIKIIENKDSIYVAPKPYEFLEIFRDLLCQENAFIEEHLQICMSKAKSDSDMLKRFLNDFQDGDVISYRDEEICTKERLWECIKTLEDEYQNFENELNHRRSNEDNSETTFFEGNYESTCQSIAELTSLIEKIKQLSK